MPSGADDTIDVLVVDDHEVVRRGLLAFLDSEPDIDVVGEAGGGAQALDLLASMESEGRRPDVIVMDLQMAPVDGIESTRRIRALYRDIEVVALTSFAEEERVHAALQAGASGYVSEGLGCRRGGGRRPGGAPGRAGHRSARRAEADVIAPRGA